MDVTAITCIDDQTTFPQRGATLALIMSASFTDGPLVAHVIIVAFHAKLGNRIEFSYPRLTGEAVLRSTDLSDSQDISADPFSPSKSPRPYVTGLTPPAQDAACAAAASPFLTPSPSLGGTRGDWGLLPDEWRFLPFMALPEGVHDLRHDVVFFKLDPHIHCVSCFRQTGSAGSVSHSASGRRGFERDIAARGSVQKAVVLLCRRPLYGVLADRLAPAVRAYFDQSDFSRTDVLASLFHSLNKSLARPSLNNPATVFHGLDLRSLVRRIGPHALVVLKLILMEKRVVFYSQPVSHASNAVVSFLSIFPGALDTVAPTMTPLCDPQWKEYGFPLALFGAHDHVIVQPYAPLPHIAELLHSSSPIDATGCVIATSHNVGMLLSSAAAAASRERSVSPTHQQRLSNASSPMNTRASSPPHRNSQLRSQSVSALSTPSNQIRKTMRAQQEEDLSDGELSPRITRSAPQKPTGSRSVPNLATPRPMFANSVSQLSGEESHSSTSLRQQRQPICGRLPVVDALVNLSTGKVSVSGSLEPLVRITKHEKRFMRDLATVAASPSSASVSESGSTGQFLGSDDHIRDRLRTYLCGFLASAATIRGVPGGPPFTGGMDSRWRRNEVEKWDVSVMAPYNERFARTWFTTRNAMVWARRFNPRIAHAQPPPAPQVITQSAANDFVGGLPAALLPAADDLVSGLRQNVVELGRLSSIFSTKAAQGISSFFRRVEAEVVRVENAVGATSRGYSPVGGALDAENTHNSVASSAALPPRPASQTLPLSRDIGALEQGFAGVQLSKSDGAVHSFVESSRSTPEQ